MKVRGSDVDDEVATLGPDEDAKAAARRMLELKIGCLPVVESGKLLGLLSESGLLRVLAD